MGHLPACCCYAGHGRGVGQPQQRCNMVLRDSGGAPVKVVWVARLGWLATCLCLLHGGGGGGGGVQHQPASTRCVQTPIAECDASGVTHWGAYSSRLREARRQVNNDSQIHCMVQSHSLRDGVCLMLRADRMRTGCGTTPVGRSSNGWTPGRLSQGAMPTPAQLLVQA
jgi:hypothetical protein